MGQTMAKPMVRVRTSHQTAHDMLMTRLQHSQLDVGHAIARTMGLLMRRVHLMPTSIELPIG